MPEKTDPNARLDAESALAQFTSTRDREGKRLAVQASGIRSMVRGGVLCVVAVGAAYLAPPAYSTVVVAVPGALGVLLLGFGLLKIVAAQHARPR